MKDLLKSMGARIAELREARGMSQEDLATLVGVSRQLVSFHEAGTRGLSAPMILGYATALKVTPNDLYEGQYFRDASPSAQVQGSAAAVRAIKALAKMDEKQRRALASVAEQMVE